MKKVLYTIGLALLAMGCTEDFTDWANPFKNDPEAAKSMTMTITPVATIDLATVTTETIQIFSPSIMIDDEAETTYEAKIYGREEGDDATFEVGADGSVAKDVLEQAVYALYGQRPVELAIPMDVSGFVKVGGQTFKAIGSTTLSVIPNAPEIEAAYYLTGSINGWDNSDTTYKLTNDGSDPYENPVFTCRIPAPEDGSNVEFKMTPESGLGGDWSKCLGSDPENEGKFKYNNEGGNFVVTYVPDALFYRVTFDMMNMTWDAVALSFNEYIYEIGNESGWSTPHALRSPASDGAYKGYYYLDGQFKFKPNENDWDGDWEWLGDNRIGQGNDNCPDPGAGFYEINVDLTSMTYELVAINQIGLIGDFNSWGGDVDLTYNRETGAWEVKGVELPKGGVKFRVNADWAINFGGDVNGLTQDGPNINIAAGTYDISLILSTEGNHKAVFTETSGAGAQYSDFIYYAGSANGWDATASPMAHEGAGVYRGWYYVLPVNEAAETWGFKFVDGSWYGDGGEGKLSTEGGNINIEEGFYMLVADMANLTYSATPATIGLIGDATPGGWDTDTEMRFDTEQGCWIYTGELITGGFKFRANHDWGFNWGGDLTNLVNNGSNIEIEAGTHTIKFWPNCEGKAYATVE